MKRRREQLSAHSTAMISSKVSTKLKQKQQGLTIGKSENDETIRPSVISANVRGNKKWH
jgi:hypothetical protein